jgi:CRISPR-associated protein Csx14
MSAPTVIAINVDLTNPGQYFACCGLLEIADRLWDGATGYFDRRQFQITTAGTLPELIQAVANTVLEQLDLNSDTSSPIGFDKTFESLRLDWWNDGRAGGKELKVWAGTMESVRIAQAMQLALRNERFHTPNLFNIGCVCFDPKDREKKVEPYYFDARRGPNAHSRDVGFSPNDLAMTTTAFPAVELFCLIGLQRCLPLKHAHRIFDYHTWSTPLPPCLLPAAVAGHLQSPNQQRYRFENWYRTGQKKHKAFRSAIPVSVGV